MKQLTIDELAVDLICPVCRTNSLHRSSLPVTGIQCTNCERVFLASQNIPSFLLEEFLDDTNRNEVQGNQYDVNDTEYIMAATNKQTGTQAYVHSLMYALQKVQSGIRTNAKVSCSQLWSLGSGTGFELKWLCRELSFSSVYSSDISASAVALVPTTLAEIDLPVGLFVSEFSHIPVAKNDARIGLVFQALHHSSDIHAALNSLLRDCFTTLVIVEPTTNWFVEILSIFGLAKRIEYSGLKPSWLNLAEAKRIAKKNQFHMFVQTWWEIPPYVSVRFDRMPFARMWLIKCVDLLSYVTNLFSFGSMSCVTFVADTRSSE